MIKASIVGATGYVGIELLRLLHDHPQVELKSLISKSHATDKLTDVYSQFLGSKLSSYRLEDYSELQVSENDIVFTALPHGISQNMVADLYSKGVKVIDMSADYRYRDIDIYESWYQQRHQFPEIAKKAIYGLVELNREEIKEAELVANPGCYVTASLLGLLPLVNKGLIDLNNIIVDAKSGVTGAGRGLKPALLFNEVHESLKAYNVSTHRHTSEIEYILNQVYNNSQHNSINRLSADEKNFKLNFTPHLIPIKRGILATIYVDLLTDIGQDDLINLYQEYYQNDQFVQILEDSLPEIKYVVGSNYCQIGFKLDQRTGKLIIISAIDNLIKGSAGQGIQNMNLIFGLEESTGLEATAVFP